MGNVISVNTGPIVPAEFARRRGRSAIKKLPTTGRVKVGPLGLEGDEQAEYFHGGELQAVYAYAREDLDWWSERLQRPLRNGIFGENLDLIDFDASGAVLAEKWQVGEVLLQVMAPRMACGTFGGWMQETGWAKRFNGARRPGVYLRVLEGGSVAVGDRVEVVWRPARHVTVAEAVGAILDEQDVLRRITAMADEEPEWDRAAMMFHVSNRTRNRAAATSATTPENAPAGTPATADATSNPAPASTGNPTSTGAPATADAPTPATTTATPTPSATTPNPTGPAPTPPTATATQGTQAPQATPAPPAQHTGQEAPATPDRPTGAVDA
ncbi:MOSC domain-containing protein [Streptomyces sp. 796.1]|uniref:MOSC domain-containing protein n=1 Tax=Streptomyces sp. 796.1 TaxID=3163029 RepID=UPI0039C8C988